MADGRLIAYLGMGLAADRPVAPNLAPGVFGQWYSTDTAEASLWDGSTWIEDIWGGGGGGSVSSVNGQTGVVVLDAADVGAVATLVPGSGVSIDSTDPQNPVVSASGGADRTTVTALSIASGVVNIDCALGDYFTLSLTANVTSITFSNLPASGKGASLAVRIRQDGAGSRTVALPSSFKATGGSDTAVQSAANAYTLLTLTTFDQGARWEYAMQEIAA